MYKCTFYPQNLYQYQSKQDTDQGRMSYFRPPDLRFRFFPVPVGSIGHPLGQIQSRCPWYVCKHSHLLIEKKMSCPFTCHPSGCLPSTWRHSQWCPWHWQSLSLPCGTNCPWSVGVHGTCLLSSPQPGSSRGGEEERGGSLVLVVWWVWGLDDYCLMLGVLNATLFHALREQIIKEKQIICLAHSTARYRYNMGIIQPRQYCWHWSSNRKNYCKMTFSSGESGCYLTRPILL